MTWLDSVESVAPPTLDTPPELLADTKPGSPPFDPLARRLPVPRGTWAVGVSYEINDLVTVSGTVFRCILANVSDASNDTTHDRYWQTWVSGGTGGGVAEGIDTWTLTDATTTAPPLTSAGAILLDTGTPLTGSRMIDVDCFGHEGRTLAIFNSTGYAHVIRDNNAGNEWTCPPGDRIFVYVDTNAALYQIGLQGPAGPTGPGGATGPAGPTGPAGASRAWLTWIDF